MIKVQGLGKDYTFCSSPLYRVGEALGLTTGKTKHVTVLDGVSFDVARGSTFGVIGSNGSGKSTLLKILCGITAPSRGTFSIGGRVASILNLGSGFHPEFTGRENVFLNGALKGVSDEKMRALLPEIERFADIGAFIDQPVKTYSNGMFLRLAFSAAIHVDPDILIIDEVLAVGDAFFQYLCFNKFREFKDRGKTIVLVTHQSHWVTSYCDQVLLLNRGRMEMVGPPKDVVEAYNKLLSEKSASSSNKVAMIVPKGHALKWATLFPVNPDEIRYGNLRAQILEAGFFAPSGEPLHILMRNRPYVLKVRLVHHEPMSAALVNFSIKDLQSLTIIETNTFFEKADLGFAEKGVVYEISFKQTILLNPGHYMLSIEAFGVEGGHYVAYDRRMDYMLLEIIAHERKSGLYDAQVEVTWLKNPILTFAVYTHSGGNYYFQEIRDLLIAGLEGLGQRTVMADEGRWVTGADWHLIIAPHEFFVLRRPGSGADALPRDLIMLSTEQPTTPWFREAVRQFNRARMIWDINPQTSDILRGMGYPCRHLLLGYVPDFPLAEPVDRLPDRTSTRFLETRIQNRSWLNGRWQERPIDILFIGGHTPRRESFFARAAGSIADHCQYIRMLNPSAPLRPSLNVDLNTEVVIGLAQRSKILLNIHRGSDNYFEWHRMVLQGMWQKAMVLSEPCAALPPFQPGRDFVEAEIEDIPACIDYYLTDPVGRKEAEKTAMRGYKTLTEEARLSESLQICLRGLLSC